MMETKCCTYCKLPKPLNRFGVRYKNGYKYTYGKCMDCQATHQRVRNYKNKEVRREMYRLNINGYRDKIRATNKKSAERRKDKLKQTRATPEWKERHKKYLKEWNPKNETKIRGYKRKYQEKIMLPLTDKYIRAKFREAGINNPTPELIELKRLQIQGLRTIKNLKHESERKNVSL